jgi:hypothetical protein
VTTITAGKTVIAQTGADPVAQNTGGLAFFKLSTAGRKLLAEATSRRLPVTVTASDASAPSGGTGAGTGIQTSVSAISAAVNLTPFSTSGQSPAKVLTDAPALRIISATSFVYRDSVGGLLTDCLSATPCVVKAKLWHGRTALATTGGEQLGAGELGYLSFKLTPAGRKMLESTAGNQLSAHAYINDGSAGAGGVITLVSYH